MLLVDTSVWSDHLRRHDTAMAMRLVAGEVLVHPFIVGEVACGEFPRRAEALTLMNLMPTVGVLGNAELLEFIERRSLAGQGIGFVDIHLLASALIAGATLWTRDRRLARAGSTLGIALVDR